MEFWFALWGNLQCAMKAAALILGCASVICLVYLWVEHTGESSKPAPPEWKGRVTKLVLGAVLAGVLACLPSMNDLWRARIALVKYELASPENVKGGVEEVQRIAHALECKYLDSCEEKKP